MSKTSKESYYDILGVSKDADLDTIKAAYKKRALQYHPDRNNGSVEASEKFKKVSAAYEVLSDSTKKQTYDKFGEEGLNGQPTGNPMEAFESMFGNMFNMGGMPGMHRQEAQVQPTIIKLGVSLATLYTGGTKHFNYTRQIVCQDCDGRGTRNKKDLLTCPECDGKGIKVHVNQIGPGMFQQMQSRCNVCTNGKVIKKNCECEKCIGRRIMEKTKQMNITITAGMNDGEKIVFSGEGNQMPDVKAGDLIFIIEAEPHKLFVRNGNNLHYKYDILLLEALCGFKFIINHLDDRQLLVKCFDNIITPNTSKVIYNEGMPVKNSKSRGDLIVDFNIIFPDVLDEEEQGLLKRALPKKTKLDYDSDKVVRVNLSNKSVSRATDNTTEDKQEEDSPFSGGIPFPGGMPFPGGIPFMRQEGGHQQQCAQQ